MDKTYQDLHICYLHDKEIVYRQLRIENIKFTKQTIIVSYKDHNELDLSICIFKVSGMSIYID